MSHITLLYHCETFLTGTLVCFSPSPAPVHVKSIDTVPTCALGLSLDGAPQIGEDAFVGREHELAQLREWLSPTLNKQNVVAVSGLGGMGKTQLSVQFAERFYEVYSSVCWINAQDERTLKMGLVGLGRRITGENISKLVGDDHEEEEIVEQVRQWFSRPDNGAWLIVMDNYDDPRLPGISSPTGYDIRRFFPPRSHGSILITTRCPRITFAKQLRLGKLEELRQSLTILARRSGRETERGKKLFKTD